MMKQSRIINTKSQPSRARPDATENYEGGVAFRISPKHDLLQLASTWLVGQPKFYTGGIDELNRARGLIAAVADEGDIKWLLDLCQYTRHDMYLRDAPIVLLVETAKYCMDNGLLTDDIKQQISSVISNICSRADQIPDLIAYWGLANNTPSGTGTSMTLPHFIRRGLNQRLARLTEYEVSKYGQRKGAVTLADAIRMCHPKPIDKQQSALYRWIVHQSPDSLSLLPDISLRRDFFSLQPDQINVAAEMLNGGKLTWEDIIQVMGSSKEAWELATQSMPYMATIRNVRNMLGYKTCREGWTHARDPVSMSAIQYAASKISNSEAILKSKIFPFRLWAAYKSIENISAPEAGVLRTAIDEAMLTSVQNIPTMPGTTMIAADVSGSMNCTISDRSIVSRANIALLMSSLSVEFCEAAIVSLFAEGFSVVAVDKSQSIMGRYNRLQAEGKKIGHSTYGYKAIKYLLDNNIDDISRIIILTDMQLYVLGQSIYYGEDLVDYWNKYKAVNPNCKLYIIDLAGYGNCMVPETAPNVSLIGGWSERVFDYINMNESLDQLEF